MPHSLPNRYTELLQLLSEADLSRFSRRLLDFIADQPVPGDLRVGAIRLRAAYNLYAAQEQATQSPEALRKLLDQAHDLLRALQAWIDTQAPATAAETPVQIRDNSVVFRGHQVTKRYDSPGHTFQLPPLDLQLRLGEITGVVGENGNGKTTLLRIVAGDLSHSSGTISYPWLKVDVPDWYRIKQRIALINQHLDPWQGYLKENLHFMAAIHGIRGRENEELVEFMLHRLGLTQYENALWSEISSGYKLRFELARALVRRPALLVIDEPLANLDINTQQIFLQDLRYLANSTQYPMSIFLSSQHLHEVESIADNILFIKNGELLYNGRMADFGRDRQENLYEFTSPLPKAEIVQRLERQIQAGHIHIEDRGRHFLARTPVTVDAQALLELLVQAQITVSYFRDISTSTLKLFRE
ncbi:MAG: hypothetical protein OHK0039_48580 [Bacteroidia bacterium]